MTNPGGNAVDYFIDRHLREGRGDRLAIADPWRSLTYAELAAAAVRFAAGLRAAGIERERRIALCMLDTIDFPIAFWGALRAGIVPVPINTLLPADITGYILGDSRAAALIVSAPLLAPLRPAIDRLAGLGPVVVSAPDGGVPAVAPPALAFNSFLAAASSAPPAECSPDEVAFWLYSSGSTGAPKGVRHVHSSLRTTADTYGAQVLGIQPNDLMFSVAKLFFAYGLGNSMTFPMAVGAAAVLLPDRPTPAAVLATMRRCRPTIFAGVPTLYAALLADPEIGPGAGSDRLRRSISAGEPLPEHIGRRWRQIVGSDILDGLGSTEMLHIFLSNRPDDIRYGTTGKPVPGYALRILDDQGGEVAPGEPGELAVSRPERRRGLLEPARQVAPYLSRRVDPHRRHLHQRCRRLLPLLRAQRRHAQGRRHLGVAVRGRGGAERPPRGARSGRRRAPRHGRADQADGLCRAAAGRAAR